MREGLPEPGDEIAGKYVVESVLGRGGMGAVYRVVHRLTGKRLALKCLLPGHANNPQVVERFLREGRAAGRIHHRHVIDVFDVGRDGETLFLVMPLLDGKPLDELFRDRGVSLSEALRVMVRAMEGVAAAHAAGILHRDLKPSNIFVCVGPSGALDDPRVLDFGISKVDDEIEAPLTRSGVALGTPRYMALEQLTGSRLADARVDVFALGVILYEALVGNPPHDAENAAALALQRMHRPPRHIALDRDDLPPGLTDAIMKALARDPEHRFADVRSMIDAITPYLPSDAGLTTPENTRVPLRTPPEALLEVNDIARASATTAPAAQHEPAVRVEVRASNAPSMRRRKRGWVALLGAAALGAFAIATSGGKPSSPSSAVRPAPPTAAPPEVPHQPVGTLTPEREVVTPDAGAPPRALKRRKRTVVEKAEGPAVVPPQVPAAMPSSMRAGDLAVDEF